MTDTLEIGLVGAGPWASMMSGPILAAGPETRVTGVWSQTADHAAALAATLGVPVFDDVDALLAACDAVSIAVTPAAQPELAIRAARAGKALLLEKPIAEDVEEAARVVDAIDAAGVPAMVMLTYRFDPALEAFLVDVERIGPTGGRACFISGAFLGGAFAHGWRLRRGAVLDIGPHVLDMLEAGLGEIVAVQAQGDPLGWVSVNCTHASGAVSSASMCCTAATDSKTEIEVYSPRGSAFYDGRAVDPPARAAEIRRAFAAVARGGHHEANAHRALHLQRLIAGIEAQLSA